MAYYRTCPFCGSNLDPNERCECREENETAPLARETASSDKTPNVIIADSAADIKAVIA